MCVRSGDMYISICIYRYVYIYMCSGKTQTGDLCVAQLYRKYENTFYSKRTRSIVRDHIL